MKMKIIFQLSGLVIICLFFSLNVSAQSRWSLVFSRDTSDWYIDKSTIKKKPTGIVQAWEKVVYQDNSYGLGLNEWKCSEKMKRLIQFSSYNQFGEPLSRSLTPLPWRNIVPDSIEEKAFNIVCKNSNKTPRNNEKAGSNLSFAKIIVNKSKLMSESNSNSEIIREVTLGEKLVLVSEEPVGIWYQVLDSKTNSQVWLNGNHFKIIKVKKSVKKAKKGKK
jgi:hypothetical protein